MDLSRLEVFGERDGRIELDTHADTCVAGKNYRLLEEPSEYVNVSPFSEEYQAIQDVPVATVGTAYTCPRTGETVILVGHQHLYFGDRMDHSLWNPNQVRHHDGKVYDCPKQFDLDSPFTIELKDELDATFEIPLSLNGVVQYFDTRCPTDSDLDTCRRIEYTSPAPWDPYSDEFADSERAAHAHKNHRLHNISALCARRISALEIAEDDSLLEATLSDQFHRACTLPSNGDSLDDGDAAVADRQVAAVSTDDRHPFLSPETLARRWGIGLDTAHRTMKATTQAGVRHLTHPIDRRLRTRRADLKFPTSNKPIYSDTMFVTTPSVRRMKCAQVFTDTEGWDHFYPSSG